MEIQAQEDHPIIRSELEAFVASDQFIWATGIEDTFVAEPHAKTNRVLDEYALTDHYGRWREDLDLVASLGVKYARYGLPWYKVNPEEGVWDWSFADKALERLLELGVQPIVDLVHYGTPTWMEGSFLNPEYPSFVAEYAAQVANRFKGRVFWYTPLNEPRINAYYCGKLGFWPPHARGWKGFLRVLVQLCKGIVLTCRRLREVDPEIVQCHVDATDIYVAMDAASQETATRKQEIVFLALDLITGKVRDLNHPLYDWVLSNGIPQSDLEWFQENHCEPDVVGLNLYPMFSLKRLSTHNNRLRSIMPYAIKMQLLEQTAQMYWERYRLPMMITETAAAGSVRKREVWLEESVQACQNLRDRQIPIIGYTWWPMFSLVAWSYLASTSEISQHVVPMGLWDLDANLDRQRTSVIELFTRHRHDIFAHVEKLRK